ncbi:unnamed protein product, partial [Discosporangium mesarthrocarpum]
MTAEQRAAVTRFILKQPPEFLAKIEGVETSKSYTFVPLDELEIDGKSPDEQRKALNKLVTDDKLFAYFVLGKDPVKTFDDFEYISNNLTDDKLKRNYQRVLTSVIRKDRIAAEGISADVAKRIQESLIIEEKQVNEEGTTEKVDDGDTVNQWAPVGFVYFLFVSIFGIANLLLTNTIEEKSNRIIEVLLSSVSPSQ